jgi:hypothetical protein
MDYSLFMLKEFPEEYPSPETEDSPYLSNDYQRNFTDFNGRTYSSVTEYIQSGGLEEEGIIMKFRQNFDLLKKLKYSLDDRIYGIVFAEKRSGWQVDQALETLHPPLSHG